MKLKEYNTANRTVADIMEGLRSGDILTRCFHGRGDRIMVPIVGPTLPQVIEARKIGVIFDVGHGCGSFSWETARKAFDLFSIRY